MGGAAPAHQESTVSQSRLWIQVGLVTSDAWLNLTELQLLPPYNKDGNIASFRVLLGVIMHAVLNVKSD